MKVKIINPRFWYKKYLDIEFEILDGFIHYKDGTKYYVVDKTKERKRLKKDKDFKACYAYCIDTKDAEIIKDIIEITAGDRFQDTIVIDTKTKKPISVSSIKILIDCAIGNVATLVFPIRGEISEVNYERTQQEYKVKKLEVELERK